jgi:membrane carboxypeptidase/penicillin-binding protein
MGKTGTTNENRTAVFCGGLPLDTLLTICSYVGFDGNDKLKGKSSSLAGASGALPQWASFAGAILAESKIETIFGESIDYINTISQGEVPLPYMPAGIEVDKKGGLPLKTDSTYANTAIFPNF